MRIDLNDFDSRRRKQDAQRRLDNARIEEYADRMGIHHSDDLLLKRYPDRLRAVADENGRAHIVPASPRFWAADPMDDDRPEDYEETYQDDGYREGRGAVFLSLLGIAGFVVCGALILAWMVVGR